MKPLRLWEKVRRVKIMIREIGLGDKERKLLINLLKDCEEELKGHNQKVLDKNKHKSNWLDNLNNNNQTIILVENLLEKLS